MCVHPKLEGEEMQRNRQAAPTRRSCAYLGRTARRTSRQTAQQCWALGRRGGQQLAGRSGPGTGCPGRTAAAGEGGRRRRARWLHHMSTPLCFPSSSCDTNRCSSVAFLVTANWLYQRKPKLVIKLLLSHRLQKYDLKHVILALVAHIRLID